MRKMGLGKTGNLSQIVPFFSHFPPISYQVHPFFSHFLECIFGNVSQFTISPQFPPISPHCATIFPFPPCSRAPAASWLIRRRLARMLERGVGRGRGQKGWAEAEAHTAGRGQGDSGGSLSGKSRGSRVGVDTVSQAETRRWRP